MKEFTLKTNLTEEDFLYMVREYNLSCKYIHKIIKNENMVVEEWSSKYNPLIKLSRFYPFENNLAALPLSDNYACIHDFVFNPYKEQFPTPKNMKE